MFSIFDANSLCCCSSVITVKWDFVCWCICFLCALFQRCLFAFMFVISVFRLAVCVAIVYSVWKGMPAPDSHSGSGW